MQGWVEPPINRRGPELAALTGQAMIDIRVDRCISSPLSRARETAEIVLRESGNEIPITTDDRIREMSCGGIEEKSITEMGDAARLFFVDPFRFPGFPNGETIQDLCSRTQEFFRELTAADDGKTYLISTHGCAMRAMLNYLFDNPSDYWRGHAPYNCAVCIVEADGGTPRVTELDKVYYDQSLIVDHYKIS
jgi:broad specificity phosphatase PhoE